MPNATLVLLSLLTGVPEQRPPSPLPPSRPASTAALQAKGIALQERGKSDEAVAAFTEAIRLQPEQAGLYLLRGQAHRGRDEQKAIADFTRAVARDPRCHEAFAARAEAYMTLRQYARAAVDFTWAAEIRPQEADYFAGRSDAYQQAGDWARALDDADRVVALQPSTARSYRLRAAIHVRRKDWTASLADSDRWVEVAPGDPQARVFRAEVRLRRALAQTGEAERPLGERYAEAGKDYDAALADIDTALGKLPDDFGLRTLRLSLLLEKQDWSGALDALRVYRTAPGAPEGEFLAIAGYCRLRQGDYTEAMKACREALVKSPGNPNACLSIALLYSLRGDVDSAAKALAVGLRSARPGDILQHRSDAERLLRQDPSASALEPVIAALQKAKAQ